MKTKSLTAVIGIGLTLVLLKVPALSAEERGFVYNPAGMRDPFIPRQMWSRYGSRGVRMEVEVGKLVLEGIVWDDETPLAIVNGEIIGEGQVISGFMLDAIDPGKIVLRRGEELHIIELIEEGD